MPFSLLAIVLVLMLAMLSYMLYRKTRDVAITTALATADAAAPSPAPEKKKLDLSVDDRVNRRDRLGTLLQRIDGGGKHYGSKRRQSNHRGRGRGKRSGRQ